jgi:AcrR family transcriptional regulator
MARPRRLAEESKARILDAAAALFARNGFDRTSLADVGEAAGVSRGLPTYFFGTKERLYTAVTERVREQVGQLVRSAVDGSGSRTIDEVLRRSVPAFIDYLAANPQIVRLLQWEFLRAPATPRQEAPVSLFYDTAGVLAQALDAAGITNIDPIHLLLSIVGMSFFPFVAVDENLIDGEFIETRKQHVLQLLLGGIKQ